MSNTASVSQRFTIAGTPEATHVTITVIDVYTSANNGFSDVTFIGKNGNINWLHFCNFVVFTLVFCHILGTIDFYCYVCL